MQHKRRIQLIQPRLQLRLILTFLGVSALALALQFILFTASLTRLAAELPADGPQLIEQVPEHVLLVLLVSIAVLLPLTFFVGVVVTFRIAGPIYRFESYLTDVIAGGKPADCRLRKGDELKDLCELINRATAPLRNRETGPAVLERPDERERAA